MRLQTVRSRESNFDKFASPQRLSIDTTVRSASQSSLRQRQMTSESQPSWHECESYQDIQDAIAHGVAPSSILHMSPTSSPASLRFAARLGVDAVAVSSVHDILKIKTYNPNARLVFRINAGDLALPNSTLSFAVETANELLDEAAAQHLEVAAVNFYVTSIDIAAFRRTIDKSSQLVEVALEVERKLNLIGVSADMISDEGSVNDHVFSPDSPLAIPHFGGAQVGRNTFGLVS